jgi:hypothetical protein
MYHDTWSHKSKKKINYKPQYLVLCNSIPKSYKTNSDKIYTKLFRDLVDEKVK